MDAKLFIPKEEFKGVIMDALEEYERKKAHIEEQKKSAEKLFSINQVARRLGRAHTTIKRLVASGAIKATPDGMVSEKSLNEYLMNV